MAWVKRTVHPTFQSEGCCFADVDGDREAELVAGDSWWTLEDARRTVFRSLNPAWLPDWGGGERVDPHAHLRRGGGPAQYRDSTYDWGLDLSGSGAADILSVGMHTDPIRWYETAGAVCGPRTW